MSAYPPAAVLLTLILGAGVVVASAVLGQAVLVMCGYRGWRWWSPAVGYGLLLAIGGQIVWLPQRARTLAVIIALVVIGALLVPRIRRDLREALPDALPVGGFVLLAALVPYLVYGRVGILGVNVSNDMAQHLSQAAWLRSHAGWLPVAAIGGPLETADYPVGPHGLAATLGLQGIGDERSFAAVQLAVPALVALVALGALRRGPRLGRWAVAALAGTSYLFISYYAQASFKETIEALLLLGTAVAVGDWAREGPTSAFRRGIPLGLLAGSAVYVYSYGGMVWPLATVVAFFAVHVLRRRGRRREALVGHAVPGLLGGLLGLWLLAAPDVTRMVVFANSFFAHEPPMGMGNLPGPLSPAKALGVSFVGDFRDSPSPGWPSYVLTGLAALALVAGLAWWWRRRELGLPIALAMAVLVWVQISLTRNLYNAAKGLPVLAPLVVVCIGAPLLAAWRRDARLGRGRGPLTVVRVVGAVLLVAGAISSFAALRDASVGLGPQSSELQALAKDTKGENTLFLGRDHFTEWMLRKTRPYSNVELYNPFVVHLRTDKLPRPGTPVDVDNVARTDLDAMNWLIAPRTAYASSIPPNFRAVRTTPSFVLYQRIGPTLSRDLIDPVGRPGALLDCRSPQGGQVLLADRLAAVRPAPIVVGQGAWQGQPLVPGASATLRIKLPPGRWNFSVQYVNETGLDVEGPGLRTQLPPYLGRIGTYWLAGAVRSDGGTTVVRVTARPRTSFGSLLGTPRPANVKYSPGGLTLNEAAFTRVNDRPRLVPVRAACGHWVDWLVPRTPRT